MSEACDRCGPAVRAAYRVERRGELYLCRQCASQQWAALSAQGWTIWPAGSTVAVSRSEAVASRTVTWRAWFAVTSGHRLLAVVGQVAAAASSRVL